MDSLATNLNFNMNIQPPPNGELWGENRNGSFTGLVGELQQDRSDIGWADLFLVPDRMKYIDYTGREFNHVDLLLTSPLLSSLHGGVRQPDAR